MLVFAAVLAPNCFRLQNLDLMKQVSQSWVFLSFSVNEKAYYKQAISICFLFQVCITKLFSFYNTPIIHILNFL